MTNEGAEVSRLFVPPPRTADAVLESAAAGIRLVVYVTDGVPVLDRVCVHHALEGLDTKRIGPSRPGLITPGDRPNSTGGRTIGIMPGPIHTEGRIGLRSKSGTLTWEAVGQPTALGLGRSTCVGLGGDPIAGLDFLDCLERSNKGPETDGVILLGKVGGHAEQRAAAWLKEPTHKPVCAFSAGRTAPPGRWARR